MNKKIILTNSLEKNILESLISYAIRECRACGVEEFSMNEEEVDSILGDRAYSGGDLPVEVLDEVDSLIDRSEKLALYLDNSGNIEKLKSYLKNLGCQFEVIEFDDEDWDEQWRKSYRPFEVTTDLWIVPEWMKKDFQGEKYIYIYPGQGFGTGKHETTFLCLKLLTELWNKKMSTILDLGCGSGILGIALLKSLRSAKVDFCDIDKAALDNTLQNLELNYGDRDLSGCSLVQRDRLIANKKYDLVFANILLNALEKERDFIGSVTREGSYLIASGLLSNQRDEFLSCYKDFELVKELTQGDWIAILMRKSKR